MKQALIALSLLTAACCPTPQPTTWFDYNESLWQNFVQARGKQIDMRSIRVRPGPGNQGDLNFYNSVLLVNLCHASQELEVQRTCHQIKTDVDWNLVDTGATPLFWDPNTGKWLHEN